MEATTIKTDDELAKELQDDVNKINGLISDAELRDLTVEVKQTNSYVIHMGQRPVSFLTLKVSKSLLEPIPIYHSGGR